MILTAVTARPVIVEHENLVVGKNISSQIQAGCQDVGQICCGSMALEMRAG